MRHGEASAGPSGESELTARGVEQATTIAEWCVDQGVALDVIFHSSKLRAKQTAEIMQSRLLPRGSAEERNGLTPDDDPFAVASMMEASDDQMLVVSHLPILDCIAGLLVESDPGRVLVGFATAQIACFEKNGDLWTLAWTRRP